MLNAMRKRYADSIILKVMFVVIVIVFIFWGFAGVVRDPMQVVAKVNDQIISVKDFDRAYTNVSRAYREAYPAGLPAEMLRGQVLEQLITEHLLGQEASRLGLMVEETELREAIASIPAFQVSGRFDRDAYVETLRRNNLKPSDFEDLQRQQLLVTKLQDVIRAGVHITDEELKDQYRHENERVNLRFVTVPAANFISQVTATDDEAKAYLAEHQDAFREPERSSIRYLIFTPEQFSADVQPTEDELKAHYEAHVSDYSQQEQVKARHILFRIAPKENDDEKKAARAEARAKAEAVLAQAKGGGDFAELAKQHSEDTSSAPNGGDLGFFSRGQMVPEFETAVFALAPGAMSEIIESPFGFHIVKVDEKREARTEPFEEARGKVLASVQTMRGRESALAKSEEAHKRVLDGEDLAAVATAMNVKLEEPPPFSRTEPVANLGVSKELTEEVFATAPNEMGEIVTLDKGYVIFQVASRVDSHVPEFEAIRDKVTEAFRKERAAALAKAQAEKLLERLKAKETLDAVAASESLEVKETGPVGRTGAYVTGLGNLPELKEVAFQLTPEQPVAARVFPLQGDTVIAVLKEKIGADQTGFDKQKDPLRDRIRRRLEASAVEQFVGQLKAKAEIEIGQAYAASS